MSCYHVHADSRETSASQRTVFSRFPPGFVFPCSLACRVTFFSSDCLFSALINKILCFPVYLSFLPIKPESNLQMFFLLFFFLKVENTVLFICFRTSLPDKNVAC